MMNKMVVANLVDLATRWEPEPGTAAPLILLVQAAQHLVQGSGLATRFARLLPQIAADLATGWQRNCFACRVIGAQCFKIRIHQSFQCLETAFIFLSNP